MKYLISAQFKPIWLASGGPLFILNSMIIKKLTLGAAETNAYLLWQKGGSEAVLIDAPHGAWAAFKPILEENNLTLSALLITHGHWDHTADSKAVKDNTGATIYAHTDDQLWIEDSSLMNTMLPPELHFEGVKIDRILDSEGSLELLGETFQIRHVPGHAPGNVLFYIEDENAAFVGDVIFSGGIGRYDLPGASFPVLEKSIRTQVYTLPDNTVLHSGHGPDTTVGVEKTSNPFVQP